MGDEWKSFKGPSKELGDAFRQEDADQMKRMEQAIILALMPFKENTDPILGLLALIRCARVMLRAASTQAQKQLLPVVVTFLRGGMQPQGAPSLLWLPVDEFRKH